MADPGWELSKENVQPLRKGRDVAALNAALKEPQRDDARMEEQRKALVAAVDSYAGADPLGPWIKLIKWTQQAFPSDPQTELLPLLEKCTRQLLSVEAYKKDVRYLRVWIQYADSCTEPRDIFKFLEANDIGQDFALFYEAYAVFCEIRGAHQKALNLYELGINRRATPVDRLKSKYVDFQARMAKRVAKQEQERQLGIGGPAAAAGSGRARGGDENGGRGERQELAALPPRVGVHRAAVAAPPAPIGAPPPQQPSSRGGLDIFVDDAFLPPGAPAADGGALAQVAAAPAGGSTWTSLPSVHEGRKENEQKATAWTGASLPPSRTARAGGAAVGPSAVASSAAAPLEVYIDEGFEAGPAPPAAPTAAAAGPSLRLQLDGGRPTKDLSADPMANFGPAGPAAQAAPASVAPLAPPPAAAKPAARPAAAGARPEIKGYDESLLAFSYGEEASFEEQRAARWIQKHGPIADAALPMAAHAAPTEAAAGSPGDMAISPESPAMPEEPAAAVCEAAAAPTVAATPAATLAAPATLAVASAVPRSPRALEGAFDGCGAGPAEGDPSALLAGGAALPLVLSPLQAVLRDEEDWLAAAELACCAEEGGLDAADAPAGGAAAPSSAAGGVLDAALAAAAASAGDMTLNTQLAFADIMSMFVDRPAAAVATGARATLGALAEESTLSTRAALADVFAMLGGGGGSAAAGGAAAADLGGVLGGDALGAAAGLACVTEAGSPGGSGFELQVYDEEAEAEAMAAQHSGGGAECGSALDADAAPSGGLLFAVYDDDADGGEGASADCSDAAPSGALQLGAEGLAAFGGLAGVVDSPEPGPYAAPEEEEAEQSEAAAPLVAEAEADAVVEAPMVSVASYFMAAAASDEAEAGALLLEVYEDEALEAPEGEGHEPAAPALLAAAVDPGEDLLAALAAATPAAAADATAAAAAAPPLEVFDDEAENRSPADELPPLHAPPAAAEPLPLVPASLPSPRALGSPEVEALVLQPLSAPRMVELGMGLEWDAVGGADAIGGPAGAAAAEGEEAADADEDGTALVMAADPEEALRSALSPEAQRGPDDFEVYCDPQADAQTDTQAEAQAEAEAPAALDVEVGAKLAAEPLAVVMAAAAVTQVEEAEAAIEPVAPEAPLEAAADETLRLETEPMAAAPKPAEEEAEETGEEEEKKQGEEEETEGITAVLAAEPLLAAAAAAAVACEPATPTAADVAAGGAASEAIASDDGLTAAYAGAAEEPTLAFNAAAVAEEHTTLVFTAPAALAHPVSDNEATVAFAAAVLALPAEAEDAPARVVAAEAGPVPAAEPPTAVPAQAEAEAAPAEAATPPASAVAAPPSIDPFDDAYVAAQLAALSPPLAAWQGVVSHAAGAPATTAALAALKSAIKKATRAASVPVLLGGKAYMVEGTAGAGAFATVLEACPVGDMNDADDDDDGASAASEAAEGSVALKVASPPCAWEFVAARRLAGRLGASAAADVLVLPSGLHLLPAGPASPAPATGVLVAPFGERGTLQDVINAYLSRGEKPDELLAMYYVTELLRLLEAMHGPGQMLHGDVKPDNLLVRDGEPAGGGARAWADWAPGRPGCWAQVGLRLIDLGRAVDLAELPAGTALRGDCRTSAFRCPQMVEGRPWLYQADAYGVASTAHCLLFGAYMETPEWAEGAGPEGQAGYRLRSPLKRYWQRELWADLFWGLLNFPTWDARPPLAALRAAFESHLAPKGRALRTLVMKNDLMLADRRAAN